MKADKSFSPWTLRHRYRRCFFEHLVVLWFIYLFLYWFSLFNLSSPFHHFHCFPLPNPPPAHISPVHWIHLFILAVLSSCFLLSSPPSCLISRDWTSQGSSQTWSHLRSVLADVLWSAAMTWPSFYRAVLVKRVTVSSPMYVIILIPQHTFVLFYNFTTFHSLVDQCGSFLVSESPSNEYLLHPPPAEKLLIGWTDLCIWYCIRQAHYTVFIKLIKTTTNKNEPQDTTLE